MSWPANKVIRKSNSEALKRLEPGWRIVSETSSFADPVFADPPVVGKTSYPGGNVGDVLTRIDDIAFGGHWEWLPPADNIDPDLYVKKAGDEMTGNLYMSLDGSDNAGVLISINGTTEQTIVDGRHFFQKGPNRPQGVSWIIGDTGNWHGLDHTSAINIPITDWGRQRVYGALPPGGLTGQVPVKLSAVENDVSWSDSSSLDLYQGSWDVGADTPPLENAGPSQVNGARYLCVTADPDVPETPPPNMPIHPPGTTEIYDGSYIIWSTSQGVWNLLASGSLSKAEADTLYIPLDAPNDSFVYGRRGNGAGGNIVWNQAVNRNGDTMLGPLVLPVGNLANNSLKFGAIANNIGFHLTGLNLIFGINGNQKWLYGETTTLVNTDLVLSNNLIQLLADPRTGIIGDQDAVNVRTLNAAIAAIPPGGPGGIPEPVTNGTFGRNWNGTVGSWLPVLPLTGGTLTGALNLAADPIQLLEAATKQYVDRVAGLGDAPNDGLIYGRGGATPAWEPVLPLTGGTVTGQIVQATAPVVNADLANKLYVDTVAATGSIYLGLWQVVSNTPDISGTAHIAASRHLCTTVDPNVPEVCPPGPLGLAGKTIAEGDFIIWDSAINQWDLIQAGGLTKTEADALYLSLSGGTVIGAIQLPAADPIAATEATHKRYVDDLFNSIDIGDLPTADYVFVGRENFSGDLNGLLEIGCYRCLAGTSSIPPGVTNAGIVNVYSTRNASGSSGVGNIFQDYFELQVPTTNPTILSHWRRGAYTGSVFGLWEQVWPNNKGFLPYALIADTVMRAGNAQGIMTGFLTLSGAPTQNLHAATKGYVDQIISAQALLIGVIYADTGNCDYTAASGFPDGALITSAASNQGDYLICVNGGTIPGGPAGGIAMNLGDWLYSDGNAWNLIAVGSGGLVTNADQIAVVPTVFGSPNVQLALQQAETDVTARMPIAGGTFTGPILGPAINAASLPLQLVTKAYVDSGGGTGAWVQIPSTGTFNSFAYVRWRFSAAGSVASIEIKGIFNSPSGLANTNNQTIGTLPAGYRPTFDIIRILVHASQNAPAANADRVLYELAINLNGTMVLNRCMASQAAIVHNTIYLDGVIFTLTGGVMSDGDEVSTDDQFTIH